MARVPPLDGSTVPNEIYDTVNEVYDSSQPLLFNDLWSYNVTRATRSGAAWSKLSPTCPHCGNGTEADGTPLRDVGGPRPRLGASLVNYGEDLYLFGGYAYGGDSTFATLYPAHPRNASYYPTLTDKYYLNDLWRYSITNNTWEKARARGGACVLMRAGAQCEHLCHSGAEAASCCRHRPQLYPVTSAAPAPRSGHSAALSLRGGAAVMFVFGGTTWDDEIGDLWAFNLSSRAWALIGGEGTFPSRRTGAVMVPVGQSASVAPGSGPQAGRLLLALGHGCLKGAAYGPASSSTTTHGVSALGGYSGWDPSLSASGNGTIAVFGSYVNATTGETVYSAVPPDMWVEALSDYGERYCVEELDDAWEYSPAACRADCSRHGACEFNACVCDPGFWGDDCSQLTCPGAVCAFDYVGRALVCDQCGAGGTCDGATGACACVFPASGPACDQFACLNGCSGHGVCDTSVADPDTGYGICTCDTVNGTAVYTGADCSVAVCPSNPTAGGTSSSVPCSGRGTCILGACVCYPGFGDSFLARTQRVAGSDVPIYIPIDRNGADIEGCGYEGGPGCEPVYVADCGSLLFVPGAAPRAAAAAAARMLAAALAAALLLLT